MSAADTPWTPGEASAVLPFARQLANWQGRIANAATNGGGLDVFKAGLEAVKQNVQPSDPFYEIAKEGIWRAAERHLADAHSADVLEAIYFDTFPESVEQNASNRELDDEATNIDNRNETSAEIKRLAKLEPIEYGRRRKDAARTIGVTVDILDKEVSERRKEREKDSAALPHWRVERWPDAVASGQLLDLSRLFSGGMSFCPSTPPKRSRSGFCMPGRSTLATFRHLSC